MSSRKKKRPAKKQPAKASKPVPDHKQKFEQLLDDAILGVKKP